MSPHEVNIKQMREQATLIFDAALRAVDPEEAVFRHVKRNGDTVEIGDKILHLNHYDRILVVGAGKADAPMAKAVEAILGKRITDGVIVVKEGHGLPLEHIQIHEAGHPVPDRRGIAGTEDVLSLITGARKSDLIICLISGGASALLVAPVGDVSLEAKQEVTRLLLACGATIHEINTVRKHLSRAKGGALARLAHPATLISLILSDVVGDNLDVIGSGPTVPDSSTFQQAAQVLKGYGIWDQVPHSVRRHIEGGTHGRVAETLKPGNPDFEKDAWELVGTNLQALTAASEEAERQGYRPLILSAMVEGETRDVAKVHIAIAKEVVLSGHPISPPACILSGGETTVTLQGKGKGGRNQEFVLASAVALEREKRIVILSGGTDGTDGPTDAAGAIADGTTLARASKKGLDPLDHLKRNDAYPFFQELGDLLITGPTRTNVMDVRIVLVGKD